MNLSIAFVLLLGDDRVCLHLRFRNRHETVEISDLKSLVYLVLHDGQFPTAEVKPAVAFEAKLVSAFLLNLLEQLFL